MKFFSIYRPESDHENSGPPTPEMIEKMGAFCQECMQSGALLYTEGLMPGSRGARVRVHNGEVTIIDNATAEPGKQIGGFAVLQGSTKEEVVELATRFLEIAGGGETELLPIFEMGECPCPTAEPQEAAGAGII